MTSVKTKRTNQRCKLLQNVKKAQRDHGQASQRTIVEVREAGIGVRVRERRPLAYLDEYEIERRPRMGYQLTAAAVAQLTTSRRTYVRDLARRSVVGRPRTPRERHNKNGIVVRCRRESNQTAGNHGSPKGKGNAAGK